MKNIAKIGLAIIFILSFSSCQTLMKNTEVNIQHLAHGRFDHDLYRLFIKFRFNSGSNPDTILASIHNLDSLASFYASRNYKPIWTRNMLNHSIIDTVNSYLKDASIHGLNPKLYNVQYIDECLNNYLTSIEKDTSINYLALANLELLLSDAIITYRNHLLYGAIDPTETDPEAYHLPLDHPDSVTFFDPLKVKDIVLYLESIQPKEEAYVNMQRALANYKGIQVQGGWRHINFVFNSDEKLEPGDTAYFLDQLAGRLIVTGELKNNYQPESIELDSISYYSRLQKDFPDSTEYNFNVTYFVYNNELAEAVKTYQNRNGLLVDGIVGNNTIFNMNIPVQDRIAQICVNLERLRWFNYPENTKYILVNIPDYKLYVIEKGKKDLEMKVCVGKKRDRNFFPNNNETPLLYGNISYFVVNPKWFVPDNIGKNEIYNKILQDPEYLAKRNFKVYFNGSEISSDSIEWNNYDADKLPFRFQQDASEGNALGKVKFIFPNNYNIYLHDTPSKRAFGYTYRAVSHGCIRLDKPIDLAQYLAQEIENINDKDINEVLSGDNAGETKTFVMTKEIPLYINYFTTWIDQEGNLQFREDVYEKDEKIRNIVI